MEIKNEANELSEEIENEANESLKEMENEADELLKEIEENKINESLEKIKNEANELSEEIEKEANELLKKIEIEIEKDTVSVFNTVYYSIKNYLLEGKDIENYIWPIILKIINQNKEFVFYTVLAFTQACLSQNKEISDIEPTILKIINQNKEFVFDTVYAFTKACLSEYKKISDIEKTILKIIELDCIKQDKKLVLDTVYTFIKGCLSEGKEISDIKPTIPRIIKAKPEFVSETVGAFTQAYLSEDKEISDIKPTILEIINQNKDFVFDTVYDFTKACLLEGKDIENYIRPIILKIIKAKPKLVYKIVSAFTLACLLQYKEISDIEPTILDIIQLDCIEQNSDFVFDTVYPFIKACLSEGKDIENYIWPITLKIIKAKPKFVYEIVDAFTLACLLRDKEISDIKPIILYIIQLDCIEQNSYFVFDTVCAFTKVCLSEGKEISDIEETILDIMQLDCIKQNKKLVFETVRAYILSFLSKGKYKELLSNFEDFLEKVKKCVKKGDKIANSLNSFSILILSQYLKDTLFTLKENEEKGSLSKKDRDLNFEKEITELLGKLYKKDFNKIKIEDLIPIWKEYFKNKIDILSINGGNLNETLPYILEIFKDKTIGYLFDYEFKQKFKNFYFINLCKKNGEEQLISLKNKSLEEKNKYFVCYTIFPQHGIVSIIQNGNIKLIDSSRISYEDYKEILNNSGFENEEIKYFNNFSYQENETCYLNATLAFKVIMKELYNKTKKINKKSINENLINENLTKVIVNLEKPLVKSKGSTKVKNVYNNEAIQKIVFEIFKESKNFYKTLKYSKTKKIDDKNLILEKDLTEILRKSSMLKKCCDKLNFIKKKRTEEQTKWQTVEYDEPLQNELKSGILIQDNWEKSYCGLSQNLLELGILIQDNWEESYYEPSQNLLKSSMTKQEKIEVEKPDRKNSSNEIKLREKENEDKNNCLSYSFQVNNL